MFFLFRFAKYQIVIEAQQFGLELPRYKGSTLRGGFGHVFRRICCSQPKEICSVCLLAQACPYALIFEPGPSPGSEVLKNYSNIPRPFVIEPPLDDKMHYAPGERLSFNLILIGQAVQYLPYFILAFKELGKVGIGRGRLPYKLVDIAAAINNRETVSIYNTSTGTITPVDSEQTAAILDESTNKTDGVLKLDFLTMTRLKFENTLTTDIPFHVLIRNLLRRISTLYYFYQDGPKLDIDYKMLIDKAEEIKIISSELRLVDWERYSQRQNTHVNMGGLVGSVVYEGNVEPFMPLIKLGEVIHVGKGCVFGLGKYEVAE
ncbi:MAG: CRISPR system precrRNA processing endoribonuclease RAMP protein Cas6 [Veillonellaceae bacterium]|jgi:hypothetical protein|nr:CRISPR system precrRNA processing endoribonuclease RAMP protein Cas6 [Veillonellaceae bacterium]